MKTIKNKLNKIKNKILNIKDKVLISMLTLSFFISSPLFADGGNPITESDIFKGVMKLLKDGGIGLMIAAPIICGILIGAFSIAKGTSAEEHDKQKWDKNRKTAIITLIWVLGASSIVTIIGAYFGTAGTV
ncbi:MAG: hypothetical protein RSE93_02175 [Oscillospiraceae bacterium]